MKKLLSLICLILIVTKINAQTPMQEKNLKSWFNDYAVCSCITQTYWIKGIKIKDSSVHFWSDKAPISSNNIENFENFINLYIEKNIYTGDLIFKNCLFIKEDEKFKDLISKIIKTDKILKLSNYKLPPLK